MIGLQGQGNLTVLLRCLPICVLHKHNQKPYANAIIDGVVHECLDFTPYRNRSAQSYLQDRYCTFLFEVQLSGLCIHCFSIA
jgi:hypothetical protein